MEVSTPRPHQDNRLQPVFPAIPSVVSYLLELTRLYEFNPKNAKTFAYVSVYDYSPYVFGWHIGFLLGVEWQGSHLDKGAFIGLTQK